MELIPILLIAAATFGICLLADRIFTKFFRGTPQHKSGKSVRLNRHVGGIGTVLFVLGLLGVLTGLGGGWLLLCGGIVVALTGAALVVYYLSFGIYYDETGFVLTTFGKRSRFYAYRDIKAQQLYITSGKTVVELHMADGRTVQLQQGMTGCYTFLDKAFDRWLLEKGLTKEACPFFDPDNSCWFPPLED